MSQNVKLNGVSIKVPFDFGTSHYNLTKSGRVASGEMTMELVAKKRKFFFEYRVLSDHEFQKIMNVINSSAMFFTISYEENGRSSAATVYVGEINYNKFRTDNGWYWKNVTFNLIEK